MIDNTARILIVGAGTFGLSTAYHLASAGYKHIAVFGKGVSVPPDSSAGNDLSKIVRADYEDRFYSELALKAMEAGQTKPLFAPYIHLTGYLHAHTSAAPDEIKNVVARLRANVSKQEVFSSAITSLESREAIRAVAPAFSGPLEWKGYLNHKAGYVRAGEAVRGLYAQSCGLGVEFHFGDACQQLLFEGDICVGVRTASGKEYTAEATVLALGASLVTVLPAIGKQLTAKAWSLMHIQLSEEESAQLKGVPVTYARDLGFFMEPDEQTGLMKLSAEGPGLTNYNSEGVSVPPGDNLGVPERDVEQIRQLLRETLPDLAERPLVGTKICWCADTVDSNYIIDIAPGKKNLVVAGGDSGHAFKMLPIMGGWVQEVLETGEQKLERWKWKNDQSEDSEVSWRIGKTTDLKDVKIIRDS